MQQLIVHCGDNTRIGGKKVGQRHSAGFLLGRGEQSLVDNIGAAYGSNLNNNALGPTLSGIKFFDCIIKRRISLVAVNMPDGESYRLGRVE